MNRKPLTINWRSLPVGMITLSLLGLAVAIYMGIMYSSHKPISCPAGGSGCETVQFSQYAAIAGIPIPWLGVAGYLAILSIVVWEQLRRVSAEEAVPVTFGLTLFGFLFSVYLTYLEAFQIKAFCTWCLTSAVIMTALFILASIRLRQTIKAIAE